MESPTDRFIQPLTYYSSGILPNADFELDGEDKAYDSYLKDKMFAHKPETTINKRVEDVLK